MIAVRLQHECVVTNWACCICGGPCQSGPVYPFAHHDTGEEIGHICERCLEATPEVRTQRAVETTQRELDYATAVLAAADKSMALARSWADVKMPTVGDLNAAGERLLKHRYGEIGDDELSLPSNHTPLEVNGKTVPVIQQK